MRYFGVYFAFFCFLFSYIFKGDADAAAVFASNMLFSYYIFTSALSFASVLIALLAVKKGFSSLFVTGFFGGLLKGAVVMFFIVLLANRGSLLLGSYLLSSSVVSNSLYEGAIGALFLVLGYAFFRPFNFSALEGPSGAKARGFHAKKSDSLREEEIIDAQIVEDFCKLKKK